MSIKIDNIDNQYIMIILDYLDNIIYLIDNISFYNIDLM